MCHKYAHYKLLIALWLRCYPTEYGKYRMAGNFHGVLIFIVTYEIMPVIYVHMEAIKARGVAKTSWKHGQLLSVLASNDHYCHPADGVHDSNGFLSMLFVWISLQKWLSDKEINWGRTVRDQDRLSSVCHWHSTMHPLIGFADMKFKTTKFNSIKGYSQKLAPPKLPAIQQFTLVHELVFPQCHTLTRL